MVVTDGVAAMGGFGQLGARVLEGYFRVHG